MTAPVDTLGVEDDLSIIDGLRIDPAFVAVPWLANRRPETGPGLETEIAGRIAAFDHCVGVGVGVGVGVEIVEVANA